MYSVEGVCTVYTVHWRRNYLTSWKIIWKLFTVLYSIVGSLSLILLQNRVWARTIFHHYFVHLFSFLSVCFLCDLLCICTRVQNKQTNLERARIRHTTNVCIATVCSNIYFFSLYLYSHVEFNFFAFSNLLHSPYSVYLSHLTFFFYSKNAFQCLCYRCDIYIFFILFSQWQV